MADRLVYLDNNATTRPAPEVVEAVLPFLNEGFGNPSSSHAVGAPARHAVETARQSVAELLGTEPGRVFFNSGATEGANTAIYSALEALPERKQIITVRTAHSALLEVSRFLGERGYRVTELDVDRLGRVDLDQLKSEVSGDTALIATLWVNNETGVIHPIDKIGDIAKQYGAMFFVDAVQAPGKLNIDLGASKAVDYMTITGHKFHGLKGSGAMFVREGAHFEPLVRGGGQEHRMRAGTENVPGIVALGAAAKLVREGRERRLPAIEALRDRLQDGLIKAVPGVVVNGDPQMRVATTLNVGFEYVSAEALLMMLDARGICASAGSACHSGAMEPSYVLRAMGVPVAALHGSVRFSLGWDTTEEEIDYVLTEVPPMIERLRELSPLEPPTGTGTGPEEDLKAHKEYFTGSPTQQLR